MAVHLSTFLPDVIDLFECVGLHFNYEWKMLIHQKSVVRKYYLAKHECRSSIHVSDTVLPHFMKGKAYVV